MLRIAITGNPGVGKSTVLRNVVKQLTCTFGGMMSADIRVKGERVGFEIRDIATGKQGILAHKKGAGPRVGKYLVNLEDLNNIGVAAIRNALNSELIVIDEIAPMEFKSPEFVRAVEAALNSGRNMLVVLHQKSNHPLAERMRKEFEVYTVTPENRESIVSEIVGKIKAPL
jgi:nucleoside-triphosphatase